MILGFFLGCVVRVGDLEMEPPPPEVDFSEEVQRLEMLLDTSESLDQRDRLNAMLHLLERTHGMLPANQALVEQYLQDLLTIEERNEVLNLAVPEAFDPMGMSIPGEGVLSQELVEKEILVGSLAADKTGESVAETKVTKAISSRLDQARLALAAEDYTLVYHLLEPLKNTPVWNEADPVWKQAEDVQARSEFQGIFMALDALPEELSIELRKIEYLRAMVQLQSLEQRFPQCNEVDVIQAAMIDLQTKFNSLDKDK